MAEKRAELHYLIAEKRGKSSGTSFTDSGASSTRSGE
jgi:hypothetical protein